jgi:hypothetical protein
MKAPSAPRSTTTEESAAEVRSLERSAIRSGRASSPSRNGSRTRAMNPTAATAFTLARGMRATGRRRSAQRAVFTRWMTRRIAEYGRRTR